MGAGPRFDGPLFSIRAGGVTCREAKARDRGPVPHGGLFLRAFVL